MLQPDAYPDSLSSQDYTGLVGSVPDTATYRFSLASQTSIQTALPEYSPFVAVEATPDTPPSAPVSAGYMHSRGAGTLQYSGTQIDSASGDRIVGPTHSILVGADMDHGASEQWPAHRIPYDFGVASGSAEKSWMTLRIFGAAGPQRTDIQVGRQRIVPLWGGGTIKGEVMFDINPKNQQAIQDVSLVVRGRIQNGSDRGQSFTFCQDKHLVWPASDSTLRGSNRFTGSHTFPFEFPLPTHVDLTNRRIVAPIPQNLDEGGDRNGRGLPISPSTTSLLSRVFRRSSLMLSGSTAGIQGNPTRLDPDITALKIDGTKYKAYWPLPHSATPSTGAVQVRYELVLQVSHGRMRPQTKIKVPVHMVPRLIPPQIMPNGGGLPTRNPAGWHELPPFDVTGRLAGVGFGSAQVTATYQLFITKPLSYLRGTSIGLFLTVKVPDGSTSSPFCSPNNINVRLRQRLDYLCDRSSSVSWSNFNALADVNQYDSAIVDGAPPGIAGGFSVLGTSIQKGDLGDDSGRGLFIHSVEDATVVVAKWEAIPLKELDSEGDTSHLERYQSFLVGRVELPKDLEPSSECPIYRRRYFLEFDVPTIPGFVPFSEANGGHSSDGASKEERAPYVSQSVDIASLPYFL